MQKWEIAYKKAKYSVKATITLVISDRRFIYTVTQKNQLHFRDNFVNLATEFSKPSFTDVITNISAKNYRKTVHHTLTVL